MEILGEIKINSFRKNNSFFNDKEKKKSFLSLNKNSLFLKRVIEIKEKERNSSKKLLGIKSIKFDNKIENSKNFETLPNQSISKIYKNPQYFQKLLNKTKADYPNRRRANKYSSNIKTISNHNTITSNSSNENCINFSFYRRYLNKNFYEKYIMNPFFSPNLINKSNKSEVLKSKTESRVLSFNGRKMFAPLSLSKQISKNIINTPKLDINKGELYRNYHDLKLKKEEIYKRKLKQNLSAENRLIINIKKDKEIKEQTIDTLEIGNKLNKSINLNKIKKIPKGNKKLKHNSISIVDNKQNIKNVKYICSKINNRIKFQTINNSSININDENKENISQNIINRNLPSFFNVSLNNNKKTMSKNYIVNDIIKESMFNSQDNKLALKIHTLKNLNQIFSKNKRYNLILSVENFHFNIPNENISKKNNKYIVKFPSKSKNNKKTIKLSTIKE